MEFEWDPKKAAANLKKHGVSFLEAMEAFADESAIDELDPAHSFNQEYRFALIGLSSRRLLFVSFTMPDESTIRLISARKANRAQERFYKHAKN